MGDVTAAAQVMGVPEDGVYVRSGLRPHRRGVDLISRALPHRNETMKVALTGRGEEAPWLRSRRNSRRPGNGRAQGLGLFEAGRAVDQQERAYEELGTGL